MKDIKVSEEDAFWLKGGVQITCLHQLIDALHEIAKANDNLLKS